MILTTYSLVYPQSNVLKRQYEVLYPNLYRDVQRLYQRYTQLIHRVVPCNVSRGTLQRCEIFV